MEVELGMDGDQYLLAVLYACAVKLNNDLYAFVNNYWLLSIMKYSTSMYAWYFYWLSRMDS